MSGRTVQSDPPAIRTFRVDVPEEALEDLRRRVAATRLPSRELVGGSLAGGAAGDGPGVGPVLGGRL